VYYLTVKSILEREKNSKVKMNIPKIIKLAIEEVKIAKEKNNNRH
jgi:hypothetical protein